MNLREAIVAAYLPKRGAQSDLAFRFKVSRQYVHQLLKETGVDTRLPARIKTSSPRRQFTDEQRAVLSLFNGARRRARATGRPFLLELEDIIMPATCPVLGIPLFSSTGRWTNNSPTLDRIDNNKGYVRGNVEVISHRANKLKSDASLEELQALARRYG